MKTLKNLLIVKSILLILVIIYLSINKHYCNWEDCGHQGEILNQWTFSSEWGYEKDTDGYLCEYTHFMNPSWTYEECEDYVFSQP